MEKEVKGTISYTITFKGNQCSIQFERSTENELAVALISHDMVRFNREYLTKLKANLKGKDLTFCRERLSKMTQTRFGLQLMVEDIARHYMSELKKETPKEEAPAEKEGA